MIYNYVGTNQVRTDTVKQSDISKNPRVQSLKWHWKFEQFDLNDGNAFDVSTIYDAAPSAAHKQLPDDDHSPPTFGSWPLPDAEGVMQRKK